MPRIRSKPINRFLLELIESKGYPTLKDAALSLGISYHTLLSLANLTDTSRIEIARVREVATRFDIEPHKFIAGLIAALSKSA